jgi:hypothetical protein
MLFDLESNTSVGNITMTHFNVDTRDRIVWWKACHSAVTDAICNQRNQITQAVKTQVLSKCTNKKVIVMNGNSPFCLNNCLHKIGLKKRAKALQQKCEDVPTQIKLPKLEDILKMRPSPTTNDGGEEGENNTKSYMFITKYLVGAVLGKKGWDKFKFCHRLSTILLRQMKPSYMLY